MKDLEYYLQVQILTAFKTAAETGNLHFFRSRGLSQQIVDNLKALPPAAIMQIAHYHPFELNCPESVFNTRMESGIRKEKQKELVHKAIQLGASRSSLRSFVNISNTEYSQIRNQYGYTSNRDKPTKIGDKQLQVISVIHNNIKKQERKLGIKYSALEMLIMLSETQDIEINQLYTYYYTNNADLFDTERSLR